VRILLVINGLDVGGTERAVEETAVCLAGRGHAVRVLALKPLGRTGRRLGGRGIDVTSLGMDDVVGFSSLLGASRRLGALLRHDPPDVVHAFLPRANIVSRLGNRLAGRRVPHVSSERSTDFRRSPRVRRLNRLTARWTDLVLAVSPLVRDVLVARDRLPAAKIRVLENGIDLAAVDAVPRADLAASVPGLRPDRAVLCSVGRFVPEKGFVHLVRAFAQMRARAQAQLLLVGDGPEEAAVREVVRAERLDATVLLAGFRPDVLGVLKASDVYVLSSVEEGSPMVVLEAMACGLPSVATDVSGVRELVGDGGPDPAALVVPPAVDWSAAVLHRNGAPSSEAERLAALAAAMDRLVADPALRGRIAHAARRRVETHYTLDRIVEQLEGHYASVRHG
jgi:glycosyltransferase involved in cell wall biosynthesis